MPSPSNDPLGRTDLGRQKPLGHILKEMGIGDDSHIKEALSIQERDGGVIGEILVSFGCVTKEHVLMALARQMGMVVVNLPESKPPSTPFQFPWP